MFTVIKQWTASSDDYSGFSIKFFNNYESSLEYLNIEENDFIGASFNPITIIFRNNEYEKYILGYERMGEEEERFVNELLKTNNNLTKQDIYRYIENQDYRYIRILIHEINTKDNYDEHIISSEGHYKYPCSLELKVLKEEEICNGMEIISNKYPKYPTYPR